MIVFDQVVHTDYGQFDLTWHAGMIGFDGDFDRFFAGQVNGLVGAADPEGVYLHFGRRSGGSALTIELADDEPPLARDAWEDIVEVSTTIPEGSIPGWSSWAGDTGGRLALPAGTYRVRASAHGRDAGAADEFADDVVDRYLVQLWPSPWRPDAILATTSTDAQYWHREVGSRR